MTETDQIWPQQPVLKKQADGQVFLFVSSKSRRVFSDTLFLGPLFHFRKAYKGEKTGPETGFQAEQGFPVLSKNQSEITIPVFTSCSTFLSEKGCPEIPV
jgi:hypothetical protein